MFLVMSFLETIKINLPTAMLFWMIFILSIIVAHVYQKKRLVYNKVGAVMIRPMNKMARFAWTTLIILGPSLLIGFRHHQLSYDTTNNVIEFLNNSSELLINDLISSRGLFLLLRYASYKIFQGNATLFLTFLAFLTLYIFVKGLDKWIDKISLPLGIFVYYTLFGMQLLNQSRQMLAVSIVFFAIYYLINGEKRKYCIIILIGTLVHFSAIIGVLFLIISFQRNKTYTIKNWVYYVLLLLSPLIIAPALKVFSMVVPAKYANYLLNISYEKVGSGLVLNVIPVLLPIFSWKKYLYGEVNNNLIRIALLSFPLRLAGYYSYFLMRMQYYPSILMVLIIPTIVRNIDKKSNKIIAIIGFVGFYLSYYIVYYMYVNGTIMFPYKSIFY